MITEPTDKKISIADANARLIERFRKEKKTLYGFIATLTLLLTLLFISVIIIIRKPNGKSVSYNHIDKLNRNLQHANDSLSKSIINQRVVIVKLTQRIDSLEKSKSKIRYVYDEKFKEIDNANIGFVVNDFSRIFSENGIK
jgi:predicted negative regulator of RcsB-dependent stress response